MTTPGMDYEVRVSDDAPWLAPGEARLPWAWRAWGEGDAVHGQCRSRAAAIATAKQAAERLAGLARGGVTAQHNYCACRQRRDRRGDVNRSEEDAGDE